MNPEATTIPTLPSEAAVLQLAPGASGCLWAATTQGLYRYAGPQAGWQLAPGLTVAQVNAVLAISRLVLAGGAGLARSLTDGREWLPCLVEQSQAVINCFAASPRFNQDNVLLAGTEGEGILRSIDGGRSWSLCNFGLRDFTILSLAVGGTWERKEPAFAGTASGIYYSPNGGRAWRLCGLEGLAVQALAVQQAVDEPTLTIYAGLEEGGMQVGRLENLDLQTLHWEAAALLGEGELAVNAVISPQPDMVLAATSNGLQRSLDGGRTWQLVSGAPEDIVCLAAADQAVYAGCAVSGVWRGEVMGQIFQRI